MQIYITKSITWDDGEFETEATTPAAAAIDHALDGWQNAEMEAHPDADDPPIGEREPVEIQVRSPNGDTCRVRVEWCDGQPVTTPLR